MSAGNPTVEIQTTCETDDRFYNQTLNIQWPIHNLTDNWRCCALF